MGRDGTLDAALEDGDPALIAAALDDITRAKDERLARRLELREVWAMIGLLTGIATEPKTVSNPGETK